MSSVGRHTARSVVEPRHEADPSPPTNFPPHATNKQTTDQTNNQPTKQTNKQTKKEYEGDQAGGGDTLCLSRTAIQPGERVLLIDDLIATGGTLLAGVELVKQQKVGILGVVDGGEVRYVECRD